MSNQAAEVPQSLPPLDERAVVVAAFAPFSPPEYVLSPFRNKGLTWIIQHTWLVVILLIVVVLLVTTVAVAPISHAMDALNYARLFAFSTRSSYMLCENYLYHTADFEEEAWQVGMFLTENGSCEEQWQTTEPLDTAIRWYHSFGFMTAGAMGYALLAAILPVLGMILLAALLFGRFIRQTPKSFYGLAAAGRLRPPAHPAPTIPAPSSRVRLRPVNWCTYAANLEHGLQGPWGKAFVASWLLIALLFAIYGLQQAETIFDYSMPFVQVWIVVVMFIVPLILVFVVAYALWTLLVVALYVRTVTPTFDLDIQPEHGDGCGGLKRLGDICFMMATMIILPGIVVAVGLLYGLYDGVPSIVPIFVVFVVAVIALFSFLTFFFPVWKVHTAMEQCKARLQEEAVQAIAPVRQRLRVLVSVALPDQAEVNRLEGQLDKLEKLYPSALKFPTWPFSTTMLIAFYTSQILPVLSVVTGLMEFFRLFLR